MEIASKMERFVAFTFAAADIVLEVDRNGMIAYAAGAVFSKFGHPPEALIGRNARDIISPTDHDVVATSLSSLTRSRRLLPTPIRLADPKRTSFSMGGLAIPAAGGQTRLCLTFAQMPRLLTGKTSSNQASELIHNIEARLKTCTPSNLGLLELASSDGRRTSYNQVLGEVLGTVAPGAVVSEVAPGRFGVIGVPGIEFDLIDLVRMLDNMFQSQGQNVVVAGYNIPLANGGLDPSQVGRALRRALDAFARDGLHGFSAAGMAGGIADYMRMVTLQTTALRQAIRERRFHLHYQPIVSLSNRRVHHYEALIRLEAVEHCPSANPQEFVTSVEALGLAQELDLAIAAMASEAAAQSRLSIAFNVSSRSVQSAEFRGRLVELLSASQACKAGLILVEMTETSEVDNLAEATQTADALRRLGVPFCLDDFGAGAADIRLLRSLGGDILKLDGSYVAGISKSGRDRAFVAGIVEIARAAGVLIVAERVETEAEAGVLLQLGVHYGQGWLFGRPAPLPAKRPGNLMQRLAKSAPPR